MTVGTNDETTPAYDQILTDIISYVYHTEIQSPRAWQSARLALLDALGCALGTLTESKEARALLGPVVPGTTVPDGFKLPGTLYQLDILKGAFDLGSLIRYLDHNDAFPGAEWGHPSDNIGAILCVADHLSRTSHSHGSPSPAPTIRTVLHSLIKAYEIQGCFQIRNAFNKVGLDHTLLVKIASTAAVSQLLHLTEPQALDALSQAWLDAAPLRAFRHPPNTGPRKGWAAGDACMRAVQMAWLARRGQPGAPRALSAPRWGFYDALFRGNKFELPRPFGSWVVENVFFKIHAVEGHGASAAEAAVRVGEALRASGRDPERDVRGVRVRTHEAAMVIIDKQGVLRNAADRDHCMQYVIAVVLLKGGMVEAADYADESAWARDARVEALRARVEMVEEPQFTADYHDNKKRSASSALTVTLNDGTVMEEVLCEYPVGHPWSEKTSPNVREKFKTKVRGWFAEGKKTKDILAFQDMDEEEFMGMKVCDFVDRFAGT